MAKRSTAGWALAGGVLGAGAVLGYFVLNASKRIEELANKEAEAAGKAFLAENYGLTEERLNKIEAYGTIFG